MIPTPDKSETDFICQKGTSLEKAAKESPDKWYIPLEHYNRITENLLSELGETQERLNRFKGGTLLLGLLSLFLLLLLLVNR